MKHEISNKNLPKKSIYKKDFVAKILKGEKELREGKGVIISLKDLWK